MESKENFDYLAWGSDNIAYGPVELPGLVNWIKSGRVTAQSWIFKGADGSWSRAGDLGELKTFFKSKSTGSTASAAGVEPGSLRRIKILAELDDRLLTSLLNYLEIVKIPQFQKVVSEGENGDALFMVLEGEVRARVTIDGRETTLTTMSVGDCFGEVAVVDQGPRSADVVANVPSVLIKVSAQSLSKLVSEAPALAAPFLLALSRVIALRVRNLTRRVEDTIHISRAAAKVDPHT